jgi:hypothetical protein
VVSDLRERASYNALVGCGTYIFALNSQQHVDATRAGERMQGRGRLAAVDGRAAVPRKTSAHTCPTLAYACISAPSPRLTRLTLPESFYCAPASLSRTPQLPPQCRLFLAPALTTPFPPFASHTRQHGAPAQPLVRAQLLLARRDAAAQPRRPHLGPRGHLRKGECERHAAGKGT